MKIKLMSKVGFCYGVERSITMAKQLINSNNPRPYYLLGMLVHNDLVNNDLKAKGFEIISLKNLDEYLNNSSSKTFISTAHGINCDIKNKILDKKFMLIDTTCPIVKKNNQKIITYYNLGYDIIYIGKNNHQESNVVKKFIHLIENTNDLSNLKIDNEKIVLMNQTTVSLVEVDTITNYVINKFPHCQIDTLICPATKERQDEVLKEVRLHHQDNDIWLIIGDKKSNNTNKLKEIISLYTPNYYFIDNLDILDEINFKKDDIVYITSGTSTPNIFIDEVINKLKGIN